MNLLMNGNDTLVSNTVTNITNIGFWVLVEGKEYFIPFAEYPCFYNATISEINNFKTLLPNQLYWEKLDCDIELEALDNPDNFPLQYNK